MTSWNIVPDADIDAESPITESLMFRLRDNPISVNENDVSVPYASLQLAEGMRTAIPAGVALASDGTKVVAGGIGSNTLASNSVLNSASLQLPIDALGTYLVHVNGRPSTVNNGNITGHCHITANVLTKQSTINVVSGVNSLSTSAFTISAGNVIWTTFSGIGNGDWFMYLVRIA